MSLLIRRRLRSTINHPERQVDDVVEDCLLIGSDECMNLLLDAVATRKVRA